MSHCASGAAAVLHTRTDDTFEETEMPRRLAEKNTEIEILEFQQLIIACIQKLEFPRQRNYQKTPTNDI